MLRVSINNTPVISWRDEVDGKDALSILFFFFFFIAEKKIFFRRESVLPDVEVGLSKRIMAQKASPFLRKHKVSSLGNNEASQEENK